MNELMAIHVGMINGNKGGNELMAIKVGMSYGNKSRNK